MPWGTDTCDGKSGEKSEPIFYVYQLSPSVLNYLPSVFISYFNHRKQIQKLFYNHFQVYDVVYLCGFY
jgi:hypothetical protein